MLRLALLLLLLPVLLFAQPDTLWTRTLTGCFRCTLNSVCVTADSQFVAVGEGDSAGMFGYNLRTVRLNSAGGVLWDRAADMGQHEFGRVVLPKADGGFIAAGCAYAYIDDWAYEVFLVRVNAVGDTQWCHIYSGVDMVETYTMGMDTVPGGGYALVSITDTDSGGCAPVLIRVSEDGDSLWSRTYVRRSSYYDKGVGVVSLSDGFAILGSCCVSYPGSGAFRLIRTNAAGDTLWTRMYLRPDFWGSSHEPVCLARATDGGFILGGDIMVGPDGDRTGIWLVRTDSLGDTLWTRELSGPGNWIIGGMAVTRDSGFAIVGSGNSNWLLAKVDRSGNVRWTKSVEIGDAEISVELGEGVVQTPDGGFVAVGENFAPFMIRTAPDTLLPTSSGTVQRAPRTFALRDCYPNPFNSTTRIAFDLPVTSAVTLNVFDINGRTVTTLAQGTYAAGQHTLLFEGSSLASGMYFYRLRAGAFHDTRKMILLR